jgi:hypothetical protein
MRNCRQRRRCGCASDESCRRLKPTRHVFVSATQDSRGRYENTCRPLKRTLDSGFRFPAMNRGALTCRREAAGACVAPPTSEWKKFRINLSGAGLKLVSSFGLDAQAKPEMAGEPKAKSEWRTAAFRRHTFAPSCVLASVRPKCLFFFGGDLRFDVHIAEFAGVEYLAAFQTFNEF